MDFLNIIATLRKFGNFLAGLFPALAVLSNRIFEFLKLKDLNAFIQKYRDKPPLSAIAPIIDRFFWKDYAKDRLEIEKIAPEMVPILKLVALISVFLVFLMPLCLVFHDNPVKISLANGADSSAPAWSVWCWISVSAFAWACLATGAAISNRLALVITSLGAVYTLGTCALFLPRSYWNISLSFSILLGIMISAKVLPMNSLKDKIGAVIASIISGAPTGLIVTALSPVHHYVKPYVLQWAGTIGSVAGLLSLGTSREKKEETQPLRLFLLTITSTSLIYLISLVVRGGLSPVGDQLLASIRLCNAYLWPIWYYIGVGIIYKLLKNARIITRAVQDLMPKRSFVPLALVALIAGLVIFWSPVIALAYFPPHPLAPLSWAFLPIYQYYRSMLNDPTNIYTSEWMRWIFAIDLFVVAWMTSKRKLTNESVGSLAYFTLLGWFFIAEYTFQISSFSHAPRHSEVLITLFAIWLLWLFHTSILEICSESSRLWPAQGRQLLYSGFVCLCLLEIAARTTVHDYGVSNEVFLMMFRGIIDVGIPYFLFVFATRRLKKLPISTLRLFQAFCLGAAFTFPINILDKFALSGGSVSGFLALWGTELELSRTTGVISESIPHLPTEWLLIRALVFSATLAMLSAGMRYIRGQQWQLRNRSEEIPDQTSASSASESIPSEAGRKPARPFQASGKPEVPLESTIKKSPPGTYSSLVFLLISFAGGFASFSKSAVDLPLPNDWKVLLSPFSMNVYLDYYWLVSYLSSWLSALTFLLLVPQDSNGSPRKVQHITAIMGSVAVNFACNWLFPGQEYELVSANVLALVGVSGIGLFLFMAQLVWTRLNLDLQKCEPDDACANTSPSHPLAQEADVETITEISSSHYKASGRLERVDAKPLFSTKEISIIATSLLFIFASLITVTMNGSRMVKYDISSFACKMSLPAHWLPIVNKANPRDSINHFYSVGETGLKSFMDVGTLPASVLSLKETFEELCAKISKSQLLKDFTPTKMEQWKEYGDVFVGYYTYTQDFDKSPIKMTGISALVRGTQGESIRFVTIYSFPSELDRRVADLRRIVAKESAKR